MSGLTDRLIAIFEASQGVPAKSAEVVVDVVVDKLRYSIGTVFVRVGSSINAHDHAGILVRTAQNECKLICLPAANRWTDGLIFSLPEGFEGPTVEEFHRAFGDSWCMTTRGTATLVDWAREDV